MRKGLTLCIFIWLTLTFHNQCTGQTFKPGIIAGMVTSQVGGDNYSGFNKIGVTFGGFVRYNMSEQWSTQFEIYYIQKGSRNDFSIDRNDPAQVSEYFIMRFNYVEIPLLFRFKFRKFIYEGGAYYGRLVGLHYEIRSDNYANVGPILSREDLNKYYNFKYPMKDWDFGIIFGLGYKITGKMLGVVRFGQSVLSMKNPESGIRDNYLTQLNIGWTNTVFTGTFRYTFGQGDE